MFLSGRRNRLLLAGALLVGVALVAALWLISREQERLHGEEVASQLQTKARLLAGVLADGRPDADRPLFRRLIATLEAENIALAIFDAEGHVLAQSAGLADADTLSIAPEVIAALRPGGTPARDVRRWGPRNAVHVMVTLPIHFGGPEARCAIWLAQPQWALIDHPGAVVRLLAFIATTATLAVIVLLTLYLRFRRRALARLVRTVRELSAGNLTSELPRDDHGELAALATALNSLRKRLAAQMELIDRQRRMLQSLVDQLHEGVIVTRDDGRIVLINPTAMRMLNLPGERGHQDFIGEPVEHCVQDHRLQRMLLPGLTPPPSPRTATSDDSGSDARLEIETGDGPIHLLARASEVILAEPGQRTVDAERGRAVLLTDITELQRIIQMRTDFVANASHELRTPLSTIRAAVETLLGMDLVEEGPAAQTFLEKIDRHSARLEAMVADLLDLSKLETPSERFKPETIDCKNLLQELYARFAERLERKGLHWHAERRPAHAATVLVNPHLLRLAVDNLLDNAIKFTDRGGHIRVQLTLTSETATLTVADTGCGIPEEDQQRVFERFYQVERARSGAERGTGLGLSIVRHAVNAMRGTVELQSTPGRGTEVSLSVPQPRYAERS